MAEVTDILQRVLERTRRDLLPWSVTSDEFTFVTYLSNTSITIQDSPFALVFRVLNSTGTEIERLESGEGAGPWIEQAAELYRLAKRISLGVDSQLNDILEELGE